MVTRKLMLVQGGSSTANLHEPHHHSAQGVKGTSSGLLKHIEPHRTYRKHTTTEKAMCVGCLCTKSGWFKHSEPTRKHIEPCDVVVRVGSMRFDGV